MMKPIKELATKSGGELDYYAAPQLWKFTHNQLEAFRLACRKELLDEIKTRGADAWVEEENISAIGKEFDFQFPAFNLKPAEDDCDWLPLYRLPEGD